MNINHSTNLKFKGMFVNILSIVVILTMTFPAAGSVYAQEPNPRMTVSITHDWFRAEEFSPGGTLNVKIYDQQAGTLLWEEDRMADTSGFMFVGEWEHPLDLKPGNYLVISDGSTTKDLMLEAITLDVFDPPADYLAGTAPPAAGGRWVWVGTGNEIYGCGMDVLADPLSGAWEADFSTQPCDVTEDMWAAAQVFDEDGDASEGNLPRNPIFTVFPEWEAIEGWGWTQDATVHLEIDDPNTPASPDYAQDAPVVPTPWNPNDIWVRFDFAGLYDVKPGDLVTLSEGGTLKTHIVRNLAISGVDEAEDTVSGTADEGATVNVWPHATGQQVQATAADGNWQADFTGIFDLTPGEGGIAEVRDDNGNATALDWRIPNPRMVVFPEWEWFDGLDWPDGATVNISVDGKPECATTKESWDGFFNGSFGEGCDLVAGDEVTFDDGTTQRYHTVRSLAVTEVDSEQDTVKGTAAEGETIYVWPHDTGQQLQATVGDTQTWQVDFTGQFDLVEGTAGRSEIRDEAGNSTAVDWNAPWSPSTFVVNTTDDGDDGECNETHCSLREAINTANARAAADTIVFDIPGDPPFSIQPQYALPDVFDPVTIDGTTQLGYEGSPVIELDGTYAGAGANGLVLASHDSIVRGTAINRFSGNGILVFGSGNTVQGNYIGTDITGTTTTGPASGPAVGAYTVEVLPETCPAYDPGTDRDGFVSESDDPLAPWSRISVTFKGTDEDKCGIPDTFEDVPLIYRYRLEFEEPTELASIAVTGAAFNGGILRVLDANMDILGTAYTIGGNSFQTNYIVLDNVVGTVFYVDEFDYSSDWRFRQSIVINGPLPLGNRGNGVLVAGGATNNVVDENLISGNGSNGVAIFNSGTTGNLVQENFIGTDVTGMQPLGNGAPGVGIGDQAYDNFIIGNLISGNRSDGVAIFNPGTNGNTLQGNNIGTDASGMAALANAGVGVWIGDGASDTRVGGTDASARNVISGNRWGGVSINDLQTTGTQVQGNYIGTDKNGVDSLPNGGDGVYISASQSTVGGPEPGSGNLISGNTASGVTLTEPGTGNLVQGNFIGTDVTGTGMLSPAGPQVGEYTVTVVEACPAYSAGTDIDGFVSESEDPLAPWSGVSIHFQGTEEGCGSPEMIGAASLIYRYRLEFAEVTPLSSISVSGAAFNGPDSVLRILDEEMNVLGTASTFGGNSFQTQYVKLHGIEGKVFYLDEFDTSSSWRFRQSIVINGPLPLGNYGNGVSIANAADNTIERNLISGNMSSGIGLYGGNTTGNLIRGNLIGTNFDGTAALPNVDGVWLGDSASNNVIGGTTEDARNIISGNNIFGVSINNPGTMGNVVQGNYIGTDANGTGRLPNIYGGVIVTLGASQNRIGGTDPGAGNVISGNNGDGVTIVDSETSENIVHGNFIGTDVTGMNALGNQYRGVFLGSGASDNLIGGNVISANGAAGIRLIDSGTTGNQIQGNFIGTDLTGLNPLGNGYIGIRITDGAANNLIGGTEPGEGNIVAFNAAPGVAMSGEGVSGNAVLSNSVFSNAGLGIDLGEDEITPNDVQDSDTGPNRLQNFPILTNVTRIGAFAKIHGLLVSSPGTMYRLEFFASDACDPSGYGEGQTYLGYATITTNKVGIGNFNITLPVSLPEDSFVTATATDPLGNTSEFSHCFGPVR